MFYFDTLWFCDVKYELRPASGGPACYKRRLDSSVAVVVYRLLYNKSDLNRTNLSVLWQILVPWPGWWSLHHHHAIAASSSQLSTWETKVSAFSLIFNENTENWLFLLHLHVEMLGSAIGICKNVVVQLWTIVHYYSDWLRTSLFSMAGMMSQCRLFLMT